jgi:Cof subfamily protein (haloacid dehalogenase superfamily)
MKIKYKALMLDIDGTIIPYDYAALPSDTVANAIKKASEKIAVNFVTGKSHNAIQPILKKIGLQTGYAVVNGGAHVIDISSGNVIYEQSIEEKDARKIISILHEDNVTFYIKQAATFNYDAGPFKKNSVLSKAFMFYTPEMFSTKEIEKISKKLSVVSNIALHKTHHKVPHMYALNITHAKATKLHGIAVILKTLNIDRKETVGVGDSYNDFPLLMACGLKVAMGNAVEDLKAIADYIAPTVAEDGVADVINKFILGLNHA